MTLRRCRFLIVHKSYRVDCSNDWQNLLSPQVSQLRRPSHPQFRGAKIVTYVLWIKAFTFRNILSFILTIVTEIFPSDNFFDWVVFIFLRQIARSLIPWAIYSVCTLELHTRVFPPLAWLLSGIQSNRCPFRCFPPDLTASLSTSTNNKIILRPCQWFACVSKLHSAPSELQSKCAWSGQSSVIMNLISGIETRAIIVLRGV